MWKQRWLGKNKEICGLIEYGSNECDSLVVTFPGLGQAMSEKNYLFSNLRKHLEKRGQKFIQFDYKGCGDSKGSMEEVNLQTMYEDSLRVVKIGIKLFKPPVLYLVGNALGGIIACRVCQKIEKLYNIDCKVIAISPIIAPIPKSRDIFAKEVLQKLNRIGSLDSQELVTGYDYYTLSDFDIHQYNYFTKFGSHLLYLHGQRISSSLIEQIDKLIPMKELMLVQNLTLIIGEKDWKFELIDQFNKVYKLEQVEYYHQHPSAMDKLIEIIESLVKGRKCTDFCPLLR
ncbi:alpha/beta fold hydrolase [Oceanobacillus profundus]|uniref:Serine aminopeptidase S33 domain-containing protein n=1 Tax=Oceanobacillus profundus TaxID=372463 RepID=A0A417YHZ3_9BACI|nr:alpha/beta fold hydrolase [Oceanobacillus profundus]RHW32574.1 hypothetical protein D1B32_09595 [Oceanobacillus profundus]